MNGVNISERHVDARLRKHQLLSAAIGCLSIAAAMCVGIEESHAGSLKDALLDGTPIIDVRYRYEMVEQANRPNDADANTVRTRAGYETASFHGAKILIEFEDIRSIGGDSYNDTINGKANYPVVADPKTTELNRLQVTFDGIPETKIVAGRQRIKVDNDRFVGNVGWRQNEQTFDAVRVSNTSLPDTELAYAYIGNANRIFGDDHPAGDLHMDTHLFHAAYSGLPIGKFTAYAYLMDIDAAAVLSSQTFGARLAGKVDLTDELKFGYTGEYAHQSEHGNNPGNFGLNYYNLAGSLAYKGFKGSVAYESLEGDGVASFKTPLATLHKFQGWADVFLNTPAQGIDDLSGGLAYARKGISDNIQGFKLAATYHDFSAESMGGNYGSEWDVVASVKFLDHLTAMIKYADYDADGFGVDVEKLWLSLGFAL